MTTEIRFNLEEDQWDHLYVKNLYYQETHGMSCSVNHNDKTEFTIGLHRVCEKHAYIINMSRNWRAGASQPSRPTGTIFNVSCLLRCISILRSHALP